MVKWSFFAIIIIAYVSAGVSIVQNTELESRVGLGIVLMGSTHYALSMVCVIFSLM